MKQQHRDTLIKQVNLNRSPTAMTHVVEGLGSVDGYVLLLTEPSMNKIRLMGATRRAQIFPRNWEANQRAAIVMDKNVIATEISELTTKDCVAVLARLAHKEVLFFWIKGTAETDASARGRPTGTVTGTAFSVP